MKQYIGDIVVQGIIWDTWVYWMFARIGISDLFISSTNLAFHRTTVERDKQGYICFFDYKSKAGSKSQGSYSDRPEFYYFYIDGQKSKNRMRPYFPFRTQWGEFKKN